MAVYTQITASDLEQFLAQFSIGKLVEFKGITAGVENTNYFVTTTQATFVLTIFEKRVEVKDLPFFLNFMNHLHAEGISCPQVITNNNDETLQTIVGKKAIIISFLDGKEIQTVTPQACYQMGKLNASLHLSVKDCTETRKNTLGLDGWVKLHASLVPHMNADLKDFIDTELEHQKNNKISDLPSGIVHADLFTDNVFFKEGKLSGVIDFYFACTERFAYDLAITITAWCFTDTFSHINIECVKAMLKGYQDIRPLNSAEKDSLSTFVRGASLRFLLTRLYDEVHTSADADVMVKDHREYLQKLKFYQSFDFKSASVF